MPIVRDIQIKLNENYQPDDHIAIAIWCEDDVINRARQRGITITKEQAQQVLDAIDSEQDCSIGINWNVLDIFTDECLAQRLNNEKEE